MTSKPGCKRSVRLSDKDCILKRGKCEVGLGCVKGDFPYPRALELGVMSTLTLCIMSRWCFAILFYPLNSVRNCLLHFIIQSTPIVSVIWTSFTMLLNITSLPSPLQVCIFSHASSWTESQVSHQVESWIQPLYSSPRRTTIATCKLVEDTARNIVKAK